MDPQPPPADPTAGAADAELAASQDWAELQGILERAVYRICPRWLADMRDDLVQLAMMRVLEIQRRSEANREFSASYLKKVAYSALIDEIRRRRRRPEADLDEETHGERFSAPEPDPEDHARGGEAGLAIQDCLGALLEKRRLAVTLYLRGHGVSEAAKLLGWPRKRADNLVYRGLQDMRACLEEKGIQP